MATLTQKIKQAIKDYEETLSKFDSFECNFGWYILFDHRADADTFTFWQTMREFIYLQECKDIQNDSKVYFIDWLKEYWATWLADILESKYQYMNISKYILEMWNEQFDDIGEELELIPVEKDDEVSEEVSEKITYSSVHVETYADFLKWWKRGFLSSKDLFHYAEVCDFSHEEVCDFIKNYMEEPLYEDDNYDDIDYDPWTVDANGHKYTALGYEKRGIFGVPVADKINGVYICCLVYEIINGYTEVRKGEHYGVSHLNKTEISILKDMGLSYDGCWITKP